MLGRMNGLIRCLAAGGAALVLAACGITRSSVVVEPAGQGGYARPAPAPAAHPAAPGGSYRVVRGDTLYSIAFRNGVDFRQLAEWNGIAPPYTIWPGQVLRLSPSGAGAAAANARHAAPRAPAAGAPANAAPTAPVFQPVESAPAVAATATPRPAATRPSGTPAPVAAPPAPAPAPAAATTVVPVAGVAATRPPPATTPTETAGATRSAGGIVWRWPADGSVIKGFRSGDAIPGIELAGKAGDPVRAAADGVVVYSGNGLVGYGELIIIKHNDSFLSAYGHNRRRLVKEGQRVSAGQQIAEMGATGASRDELQFQIRKDGNPVDPLGYLPPR
ncbi:peptidoglycan DD-metalloendopeptidase family protein [Fulvimonas soli]|jgi:lipoprotein NlpD|uniref:Murein DD-endopeptidase MepM/ murein hydrolase activator NlpD n=1 Tax=Fulvimonas soli TaxID=155197 RepID=A0A316IHK6_9GAMM|nr:peptidoglycan DD-metalloendopeptidase family protein [Fulvimonas soli]PWK92992.1 murein DD-endopeptidase MepM/ murein hydrolase activator NlpD [Fulvimonas soli]TNY26428.1 peptidase M23 [Fulvimonas soli]